MQWQRSDASVEVTCARCSTCLAACFCFITGFNQAKPSKNELRGRKPKCCEAASPSESQSIIASSSACSKHDIGAQRHVAGEHVSSATQCRKDACSTTNCCSHRFQVQRCLRELLGPWPGRFLRSDVGARGGGGASVWWCTRRRLSSASTCGTSLCTFFPTF